VSTDALATELLHALDENALIQTPFTDRDRAFDNAQAYEINAELFRRRVARGEKPIGRKIGFTNRTIWPEYGVYTPMWAHMYDTTVTYFAGDTGALKIGHLAQPRIEPEILFHFGSAPSADASERELQRALTPVAKYWLCKRITPVATEAMECVGGNG
jgi:2-oxo-3-hexenedioate decarboxylase